MNTTADLKRDVTAVILAGGMARRMEGVDKGLVEIAGREMVGYVVDTLQQQVDHIVINANRNHERYKKYSANVVADSIEGYQGPLAGIEAGLSVATTPWVFTCPCDSPMQSVDLLPHMWNAVQSASVDIAVAHDGEGVLSGAGVAYQKRALGFARQHGLRALPIHAGYEPGPLVVVWKTFYMLRSALLPGGG